MRKKDILISILLLFIISVMILIIKNSTQFSNELSAPTYR